MPVRAESIESGFSSLPDRCIATGVLGEDIEERLLEPRGVECGVDEEEDGCEDLSTDIEDEVDEDSKTLSEPPLIDL